jgi:hypothetical protein
MADSGTFEGRSGSTEERLAIIEQLLLERDRYYREWFRQQEANIATALTTHKELVASAFASHEKAILKTEASYHEEKIQSRASIDELEDWAKTLMSRNECLEMFSGLRREFISGMDTNRSRIEGLEMAKANFDGKLASWGIVLTILTVAVNVVSGYLSHGMK